jgi:glutathione synthase/RimK-type ligase-like ATP-grasp enzyme
MIACLYGRDFAPFVEPVVRDVSAAAAKAGGEIVPLTIETALAAPARCAMMRRLYVLPFDPPSAESLRRTGPPAAPDIPATPAALVRALFPRAEIFTSFAVQELCWDKLATQERLLERGVPVPDTLVTSEPADVLDFVRRHGFAILKERFSCGGHGHIVVWFENDDLVGDSGSHQYRIELVSSGVRQLRGDRFTYPAPFYLQRLVADVGPRALTPGQILRAYVIDSQIVFWTERYRERYIRPSDWIVNVSRGARYRFVLSVSEEMQKIAVRTAEVIGMRAGVVDLIRTGNQGPYVLEADTDSTHMIIDRQFKQIPEYREFFDFDRYLAEALLAEPVAAKKTGNLGI